MLLIEFLLSFFSETDFLLNTVHLPENTLLYIKLHKNENINNYKD